MDDAIKIKFIATTLKGKIISVNAEAERFTWESASENEKIKLAELSLQPYVKKIQNITYTYEEGV